MKKIKSIFVILIFMFIGGFLGYFLPFINDRIDFHIENVGILAWLPLFVLFILTATFYYVGKVIVEEGVEDDKSYDKAIKFLCLASGCDGISTPILMITMILAFADIIEMTWLTIILNLCFMILFIYIQSYYHKKIIDVTKVIAPEKKGEVFDPNFAKDWISSMDEAELSLMYQSSYFAFKNMNVVYSIILFILFILSSANAVDAWFPLTIGILWILQNAFYLVYAYKMEHGKKKESANKEKKRYYRIHMKDIIVMATGAFVGGLAAYYLWLIDFI